MNTIIFACSTLRKELLAAMKELESIPTRIFESGILKEDGLLVLGTLGERSYRFWLGLIVAAATGCALLLFSVTG